MRNFVPVQLARRWADVSVEIERSRASLGIDEVHDLRVALRRYNEALRLFEPWTGRRYSKALRRALKPLRKTAGEVRDLDVAAGLLEKACSPVSLAGRREAGAGLLRQALRVDYPAPPPPLVTADEPAPDVARRLLPKTTNWFFKKGAKLRGEDPDDEALHDFRIDGKHFRYTLELFSPLYGPALANRVAALRSIQQALGDLNDCVVLGRMQELHDDPGLAAWLQERAARKRKEFREAWDANFQSARLWSSYFRRWAHPERPTGSDASDPGHRVARGRARATI
jgi:CHAD domain-containing protein